MATDASLFNTLLLLIEKYLRHHFLFKELKLYLGMKMSMMKMF